MNNLFYSYALDFGYKTFILDIFFFLSIVCSVFVLISKNPVVSVLFLIGLFINVSCYLISIGLEFIGLAYLLVYVGAVSILFLFILMLINIRISELLSDTSKTIPLAIFAGIAFNYIGESILPFSIFSGNVYDTSVLNKIIETDFTSFVTSSS
jgi:NADH-ubiquinone oxidoreductase chain 6